MKGFKFFINNSVIFLFYYYRNIIIVLAFNKMVCVLLSLQLVLSIITFPLIKSSNSPGQSNDYYLRQEMLSELYYQNQKKELKVQLDSFQDFLHINANWPCIAGYTLLGNESASSIYDGHKYACGLQSIKGAPIVYSFGSHKQTDFEDSLVEIRPDASVHVFELLKNQLPLEENRKKQVKYYHLGLGYRNRTSSDENIGKFYSLQGLMDILGHTHVDILKIDITGGEWEHIKREGAQVYPKIGQVLIEVHISRGRELESPVKYLHKMEALNFRFFHKELNFLSKGCCSEFSFIRKDWHLWNQDTKFKL